MNKAELEAKVESLIEEITFLKNLYEEVGTFPTPFSPWDIF